jgi:hypothetical protein
LWLPVLYLLDPDRDTVERRPLEVGTVVMQTIACLVGALWGYLFSQAREHEKLLRELELRVSELEAAVYWEPDPDGGDPILEASTNDVVVLKRKVA